ISPFKPTSYDKPVVYPPGTPEVEIKIIGNSFSPKVVQIAPGTTVKWTNEDVFTYLSGEFAGVHNASGNDGTEDGEAFTTPLLAHGESATHLFEKEGTFNYICVPHPYMHGTLIVKEPEGGVPAATVGGGGGTSPGYL